MARRRDQKVRGRKRADFGGVKNTKSKFVNDFSVTVSVLTFISSVVTLLRERERKEGSS